MRRQKEKIKLTLQIKQKTENDTEYAETDHTENLTDMIENDTEE